MTLTVHMLIQDGGQPANDLFVWGDDFETILDILEGDELTEEQFSVAVTNVSITVDYFALLSSNLPYISCTPRQFYSFY